MKLNVYSIGLLSICVVSSAVLSADPKFYIKNKFSNPIELNLKQGGMLIRSIKLQANDGDGGLTINKFNTTVDTDVKIGYFACANGKTCKKGEEPIYKEYKAIIKGSPDANTTIYVKFKDRKLEPQKGVRGKTEDGKYSLENNITAADIKAR